MTVGPMLIVTSSLRLSLAHCDMIQTCKYASHTYMQEYNLFGHAVACNANYRSASMLSRLLGVGHVSMCLCRSGLYAHALGLPCTVMLSSVGICTERLQEWDGETGCQSGKRVQRPSASLL